MPAPSPPPSARDATSCLLVTGASGNLGRLVLHHLLDTLHIAPCRLVAGSRTPENLDEFAKRGVLTRYLDFADASSVATAAQFVDRVLMISVPDAPDRVALHEHAITTLVAAGVQHILYTSFLDADNATALGLVDHRETEAFLRRNDRLAGYTFLRNSLYYDNYAVWIAGNSHYSGAWHSAAKRGRLAGIARDDAARAAATALASVPNHSRNIYEIASTQGLTIDEIVTNIGKAVGRPIHAVQESEDQLTDEIVECTGVRRSVARIYAAIDAHVAAGLAQPRGNDYERLTGRPPLTHAQWVEAHKAELSTI